MLSRVAESLMWLSRYLERAKSLVRLVEVADQLALDYSHPDSNDIDLFWKPILFASGSREEDFKDLKTDEEYLYFLLLDRENPGSVFAGLAAARENARGAREQLTTELWEVLNELYLWCSDRVKKGGTINTATFSSRVRQGCLQLRGLIDEMMPREEPWSFLRLGTMLERADQTSRLLDLRTFMLGKGKDYDKGFEPYVWLCIMQGCGAGSQRGFGNIDADWPHLNRTLIYSSIFPQSVLYCVKEVYGILSASEDAPTMSCEKLLRQLQTDSIDGVVPKDLHGYLDSIQQKLNVIGSEIQNFHSCSDEEEDGEGQEQSQEGDSMTQTQKVES